MNLKEENKIILIYLILGGVWIYFSDKALLLLFDDSRVISEIQTYKGWIFVMFTGLIFYILIKSYFTKIRKAKKELKIKNQVLSEYNIELKQGNRSLKRSYHDLSEQTEDLKIMIDFINNINKEKFLKEDKFLSLLLRTAVKLISKSDYGSIYKIR
ncbi:MAG: PAS sensor protein, partial [Halanaerobiales bacterium]|nr:PAS sensor protein [Halanaerobiales bacterium]